VKEVELNTNDKAVLVRAIAYYYKNCIWDTLQCQDNAEASDEDYALRDVLKKLGLRDMLPVDIGARL
jgi:uncharacterized protein with von Willebrand factor type A (vWA) domain